MIDAHVHLEKGKYSIDWVNEFIKDALERNIDEIYFLEHTHLFKEFESLYFEMSNYNEYQKNWFRKKSDKMTSVEPYLDFINNMKKVKFPIKVKFGLEVCYSPEHERDIQMVKDTYPFDFMVGSIHFIDGWAFSHLKQPWSKEDYNLEDLYQRYYELMCQLVDSHLFSGLAHPNSLQCFGAYPDKDYSAEYDCIASKLRAANMYVEESSGLAISYGDKQLGMNTSMLKSMLKHKVEILTASDAHYPQNVGMYIKEMNKLIHKNN